MPRIALSPEKKKDHMVSDLPYWLEKEARKKGMHQADLARAIDITPQAWNERKKKKRNGKPKDSFSYGDLLILFNLLDTPENERQKVMAL